MRLLMASGGDRCLSGALVTETLLRPSVSVRSPVFMGTAGVEPVVATRVGVCCHYALDLTFATLVLRCALYYGIRTHLLIRGVSAHHSDPLSYGLR